MRPGTQMVTVQIKHSTWAPEAWHSPSLPATPAKWTGQALGLPFLRCSAGLSQRLRMSTALGRCPPRYVMVGTPERTPCQLPKSTRAKRSFRHTLNALCSVCVRNNRLPKFSDTDSNANVLRNTLALHPEIMFCHRPGDPQADTQKQCS